MGICEPRIRVECDKCGVSDEYEMTLLAGGAWDDRNLEKKLIRDKWFVNGEETICPECMEEEAQSSARETEPSPHHGKTGA